MRDINEIETPYRSTDEYKHAAEIAERQNRDISAMNIEDILEERAAWYRSIGDKARIINSVDDVRLREDVEAVEVTGDMGWWEATERGLI